MYSTYTSLLSWKKSFLPKSSTTPSNSHLIPMLLKPCSNFLGHDFTVSWGLSPLGLLSNLISNVVFFVYGLTCSIWISHVLKCVSPDGPCIAPLQAAGKRWYIGKHELREVQMVCTGFTWGWTGTQQTQQSPLLHYSEMEMYIVVHARWEHKCSRTVMTSSGLLLQRSSVQISIPWSMPLTLKCSVV